MEIESENEISVFPWANIGQKDHSNPYVESTTVLSDIESITILTDNIINPWRACAARVTVVVLCVFVHDYSRTTGYEAAYERYQHLQCHKGTKYLNWRFC